MDDLEFVRRFVTGDIPAREEFHKRYSRLIYNYIHHVLALKGLGSYADHVNEAYQGFFAFIMEDDCRRLKSFKARNNCTLATWIRQLTVNFTRDYLRKIKPMLSVNAREDDGLSLEDTLKDNSLSIADAMAMEERIKVLDYCIELLSDEDRYFIELNFNQGIKLEVLKDFFKVSRGAIDMQKSRILSRLRDCFRAKGFLS